MVGMSKADRTAFSLLSESTAKARLLAEQVLSTHFIYLIDFTDMSIPSTHQLPEFLNRSVHTSHGMIVQNIVIPQPARR